MGWVLLRPLGWEEVTPRLFFFLLNGVKQAEQDFLAPLEQDSLVTVARLVPVEAAERLPAGLV
jgi:hypothetical protein